MTFHEAVQKAELSDRQLAQRTGCSPVMIQSIRLGRRTPSPILALRISRVLAEELNLSPQEVAVTVFRDVILPVMTEWERTYDHEEEAAHA